MPNLFKRTLLASGILAVALAGCSEPLSQAELLERAQASLAAGNLSAAVIDAKSALQQDTRNAEGRRLLGEVFLQQRQLEEAVVEFEKSLEGAPDPAVAVLYADALLESGQLQKLIDLYDSSEFVFVGQNPEWLASVARAQTLVGDSFAADDTLAAAVALAPESPRVRIAQAVVAARHGGDIDTARTILQELTQSHPELAEVWSLYGSVVQAQGDLEAAEQAFAKAGSLNSSRLNDRLSLVGVLIEQDKFEAASEELVKLDKLIPTHPGVNYAQARILLEGGDAGAALVELAQVFNIAPDHLPSLYLAASANYREGNLSTAEGQLTRVLGQQPRNFNARQMLAAVYLQLGEPKQAESVARQLLEELPMNAQTMSILALALAAQGVYGASADVYEDLVSANPDSASMQMELGTALARSGDIASGIEALQAAKALEPGNTEVRARLVQAYMANSDRAAADKELSEFRRQSPDSPLPSLLAGQLALADGDSEQAAEAFRAALNLDATNAQARDGLVSLAMLDDNSELALEILNEGLEAQPDDLSSLLKLAAVHEQRGEEAEMVSVLQRAVAAHPTALDPRLMLARYSFREGRAGEAVNLLTEVRDAHDTDPRIHQLLTGAFLAVQQPGAAVTSGRRLAALLPESPRALLLAAQAESANNDLPAAEQWVRKAVDLQPDDADSRKMLVEVLVQQNKLAEASEQMNLLPEGAIPEPQRNLSSGRLALAQGDFVVAQEFLSKAHAAQPSSASVVPLSVAMRQQGQTKETYALLEGWVQQNAEDLAALNQLGSLYASDGRDDDAVRVYEALYALAPDDVVVLNNLAWAYRKADSSRAMELVDKALQSAPGNPSILDTRAMILLESGDVEQALTVSQQALDAAPNSPQLQYHRAMVLAASGNKAGATELLEPLVAEAVVFAEQAQAKALLAELQGG